MSFLILFKIFVQTNLNSVIWDRNQMSIGDINFVVRDILASISADSVLLGLQLGSQLQMDWEI